MKILIIEDEEAPANVLEEKFRDEGLETAIARDGEAPVIALSSPEGDESIKQALKLGAIDYYVKTQHPIKEIAEKAGNYFVSSGR